MENSREEISMQIGELTRSLSSSYSPIGDWKIIKIYEARMKGEADPYDFDELCEKRQAARDEINRLQEELEKAEESGA